MHPGAAEIGLILSGSGIEDSILVRGPAGALRSPALVACALPYPLEGDPERGAGEAPFGVIACFARTHHYRVLADRLIAARDSIIASSRSRGENPSKADFPIHVNSRLDEKDIALRSGLGGIGLHSLLITAKSGCACVLGVMGLPYVPEGTADAARGLSPLPECLSCRACARACPTGAIRETGGIDTELCLQAYLSSDRPAPPRIEEKWGGRLYGCDECLRACPRSRGTLPPNLSDGEKEKGRIGAKMDLEPILGGDDAALKARLKGTALGLSWLGPKTIRKNAALALRWLEMAGKDA